MNGSRGPDAFFVNSPEPVMEMLTIPTLRVSRAELLNRDACGDRSVRMKISSIREIGGSNQI